MIPRTTQSRGSWRDPLGLLMWIVTLGVTLGLPIPTRSSEPSSARTLPPRNLQLKDAITLALANDPNLFLAEADLANAEGALKIASSGFAPALALSATRDDDVDQPDTIQTSVGLTQRLRTGLEMAPRVDFLRTDGSPTVTDATVSFEVRQPLLRDRGRQASAGGEMAARRQLKARRLDLEHRIAERLRIVAASYWSVSAAIADLEILNTTEHSIQQLIQTTQRLVEADITPASELVLLDADLASKESDRIAGERSLYQAHFNLAREIGVDASLLPLPSDPFPAFFDFEIPASIRISSLVETALQKRADLQAERERKGATEILLASAENAVKPRLDLVFTPSYTGQAVGEGREAVFDAFSQNIPGLRTVVGVDFAWPFLNQAAAGELLQAQSEVSRAQASIDLSIRQIAADVPISLDALRTGLQQLERAERTVRLFEQAVNNEEKKLRGGSSTLIDVLSQRDRLTASRRRLVATREDLALALVDIRFQMGSLVRAGGDRHTVRVNDLTTVSDLAEEVP